MSFSKQIAWIKPITISLSCEIKYTPHCSVSNIQMYVINPITLLELIISLSSVTIF